MPLINEHVDKNGFSLIIIHFQVVYIPRAWYYMFIQVFKKVCSYTRHRSDAIWSFPIGP